MKTIYFFILLLTTISTTGQEQSITGKVTDATDGAALPGVIITIKNSSEGTQTNFNGDYSIQVKTNDTLVFSFIGMKKIDLL